MTRNRFGIPLLFAVAASAAGCTLFNPPAPTPQPPSEPEPMPAEPLMPSDADEVARLLNYYRQLQTMAEKELEQERQRQSAAIVDERCDPARLQLGLVLLRASELNLRLDIPENLLKPCLIEPTLVNTSGQNLAHLLQSQLRVASGYQLRVRAVTQEAELLRKENLELKRQLDGLKAIERSLQDRRRRQTEEPNGTSR